jgi:hypothetical protein
MQHDTDGNPEDMDQAPNQPRPPGTVAGTRDVTGEPGIESATGRDRSQGEFPREYGTNRLPDDRPGTAEKLAEKLDTAGFDDETGGETTTMGTTGGVEMGDASSGLRDLENG